MGTFTLMGSTSGLASGQSVTGPITMTGVNTVGSIIDANLSSGDNTFAVPSFPPAGQVTAVAIFLGSGPAVTVKVRTNLNVGDGGLEIAPYSGVGFAVFPLPPGSTELILNSSGSLAGIELKFI
jgi:hypothetical protein